MAEPMDIAVGTLTSGWGNLAQYGWLIGAVIGFVIIGSIIFLVAYSIKTRSKWNIQIRLRQEDKTHKTIYLDPKIIKGKRVTLSNGLRLIYLETPILGKKLFPNLNNRVLGKIISSIEFFLQGLVLVTTLAYTVK